MLIRHLAVIIIVFFYGCSDVSEKEPTEINLRITEDVVASFKANQFEKVYSYFNDEMKKQLDVRGIENMWNGVLIQVGNFHGSDKITAESIGKIEIVWCDLKFDDTTAYLKIAFNDENKIAGMFVLPTKH
jgi:hypothetical protein